METYRSILRICRGKRKGREKQRKSKRGDAAGPLLKPVSILVGVRWMVPNMSAESREIGEILWNENFK
jgi:hypothetical protein